VVAFCLERRQQCAPAARGIGEGNDGSDLVDGLDFLRPAGVQMARVAPQKATASETLRLSLERRGFVIEAGTVHECGCAVSARRREMNPVRKAA